MSLKLTYQQKIADKIRAGILAGVKMETIYEEVKQMHGGPRGKDGMYNLYRHDIAAARMDIQSRLGNKAMEMALAGNERMLELALRSKAGWSPTQTIIEQDAGDLVEETSAIDDILVLLKAKKTSKDDAEEETSGNTRE